MRKPRAAVAAGPIVYFFLILSSSSNCDRCMGLSLLTGAGRWAAVSSSTSSRLRFPKGHFRRRRPFEMLRVSSSSSSQSGNSQVESTQNSGAPQDDHPSINKSNDDENAFHQNTTTEVNSCSNYTNTSNSSSSRRRRSAPPLPPTPASDFPAWAYEPRDFFSFEILHTSTKSRARVGRIHTPHGTIDTPSFVAVATNGALKGVDFRQADAAHQQLIFANTYHLLLQPGADVIEQAGGIHQWTGRTDRPFITDSGGFQVFSLAYGSIFEELASKGELKKRSTSKNKRTNHSSQLTGQDAVKVTEDGVVFRSYRDGSKFLLTPETTVQAQKQIGADIIIPLDELPGFYVDRERLVESVARTHRWESRSLLEHLKSVKNQAMYCVIHGGADKDLRKQSVDYLTSLPFDGYGIGGSLGDGRDQLKEILTWLMPMFEKDERIQSKPRHLLGFADEESIRNAVPLGIDTVDSCYPTRLGRHGTVLTRQGTIRLQSGTHARSFDIKIDSACTCSTCALYDRAYLWHLFKANEPIAVNLAATHNIHYMNDLMAQIRQDIMDNKI